MKTTIYYKVLNSDGTPCHGGTGQWHLPDGDQPGAWMPAIDYPVPCKRGYHLCRDALDLLEWLGPEIWVAEADGAIVPDNNKVAVGRARLIRRLPWDERVMRRFAADCAERALPVYEAECPGDDRPRRAVEVARRHAEGAASGDELAAAADAARAADWAAEAAAWDAADGAAWDAAWAAWDAARAAARAAAEGAAWAAAGAAWAAAGAAAWAAERQWQADHLAHLLGLTNRTDH